MVEGGEVGEESKEGGTLEVRVEGKGFFELGEVEVTRSYSDRVETLFLKVIEFTLCPMIEIVEFELPHIP